MKKFTKALLISSLGVALYAAPIFVNDPIDDEFAKMQQYLNSMLQTHLSAPAIANYNYPRTNIQDTKDTIILDFDLAGIDKKNIKLSIDENNVLTLEGKKESKVEEKDDKGEYVRREIFYGSFHRAIQLPENIVQEKLKTKYENGVLHVTIPKKEIKKPKAKIIPIN
ncbi:MAG: Hsp20/alpha crystallin family protein [Epsilonproteobacteria bacterium]|nr:Hsp20/alpha crystallin family protein [Campylobacterota bacterium]